MNDRVVVVNFFFACCSGSCPTLMDKMRAIQDRFQDRLGKDLVLLSISVDPDRDDIQRLAGFAKKLEARPGWHLVTAPKADLERVLSRFGQRLGAPEDHTNVIMVGNEKTKLWKKLNGLSPPSELIPLVAEVLDDRGGSAATASP